VEELGCGGQGAPGREFAKNGSAIAVVEHGAYMRPVGV
jgi:hypothetical protein